MNTKTIRINNDLQICCIPTRTIDLNRSEKRILLFVSNRQMKIFLKTSYDRLIYYPKIIVFSRKSILRLLFNIEHRYKLKILMNAYRIPK